MSEIRRIIFVSGYGSCRAPMACEILKAQKLSFPVEILARGRSVLFPEPMNPKMLAVLSANDISCEASMSRKLADDEITEYTLLFTMDEKQRRDIIAGFDHATEENTLVLSTYVGDELDIMNPYGGTLQQYGLCFEVLKNTIAKLVVKLEEQYAG